MKDLLDRGLLRRPVNDRPPVYFLWAASDLPARMGYPPERGEDGGQYGHLVRPPTPPPGCGRGRNNTECVTLLLKQIADVFRQNGRYEQQLIDRHTYSKTMHFVAIEAHPTDGLQPPPGFSAHATYVLHDEHEHDSDAQLDTSDLTHAP